MAQIIIQQCQIAVPKWPNNNSSALIMRSSKTGCKTSSVASAVWHVVPPLLKPNVVNILLFSFCEQRFVQHGSITITIDCNGISLLIFEEKCPNYASGPKSTPKSDSFWVRWFFNVCVRVFCAPNATILLVYIAATIKMNCIWKHDFFCQNRQKSIAGPFSSVVQTYTQPYSFSDKDKTNYLSNQTWAKCYHLWNKH